ncbi:hypothetical protein L228DRAFT_239916 [Xylona heveae TC161]|uniref:Uncharacterized protein n=1 Tax=Xylona heveae (strain CBS 132557 / TC161) TaxID=1328760 RepID=A0A165FIT7_XYLHT|nr:hypothetical protein L228DRAFT_239916 [Xylona heveae TC161]KZF21027.1 hypothetical protein L228DRAFT_239916 [Xylona heveae TC161]
MPYIQRQVGFDPVLNYTRPATAEERAAIKNFELHARRCTQCAYPYDTFRRGKSLCERGHAYAIDIAEYMYSKAGQAYSTTDREDGNQPVQVEIPSDCEVVRELLQAMSDGLRLRRSPKTAPAVTSYDQTYYVAPRPPPRRSATTVGATGVSASASRSPARSPAVSSSASQVKVTYAQVPEVKSPYISQSRRSTATTSSSNSIPTVMETYNRSSPSKRETVYYADKRDEPRRGSLYRRDLAERRERYKGYYDEQPRYYR